MKKDAGGCRAVASSQLNQLFTQARIALVKCNFVRSQPASSALNAHFPATAVVSQEYFVCARDDLVSGGSDVAAA